MPPPPVVEGNVVKGWCRPLFPGHVPACVILIDGRRCAIVDAFIDWDECRRRQGGGDLYRFEYRIPDPLLDGGVHRIDLVEAAYGLPLSLPLFAHFHEPGWIAALGFSDDFLKRSLVHADQLDLVASEPAGLRERGGDSRIAICCASELVGGDQSYRTLSADLISFPSATLRPDRGLCYLEGRGVWAGSLYLADTDCLDADLARIAAGQPLRPRLPGLSLALNNCAYRNYFHWHLDCLSGLHLVAESLGLSDITLVSGRLAPWQRESVALLAPNARLVEVPDGELQPCERVIFPSYLAGRGAFPDRTVKAMFAKLASAAPPAPGRTAPLPQPKG